MAGNLSFGSSWNCGGEGWGGEGWGFTIWAKWVYILKGACLC